MAGGTTTDVGALVKGLPRPAAATVDIAGVRTNFAMPDILSIGGSLGFLTCIRLVSSRTCVIPVLGLPCVCRQKFVV